MAPTEPVSIQLNTVAFLGMGIMGQCMAQRLVGDFKLTVWNRTQSKCDALKTAGAQVAATPAEAAASCDVTFAMLADPDTALQAVFGEDGVLKGLGPGKGYCDMSTVDEATSTKIAEAVRATGALFLEAPVSGSKKPAMDGQLIIMAAGDEPLFHTALPAFNKMGKRSMYLGATGAAARMKLVVNMVMGSMMGAFCEGMALADKAGLSQADLLEVLGLGAMQNPMFALKGPAIQARNFPPAFPLKHQQKDLRLALALGDQLEVPLPVAAAANEVYKAARAMGHGDDDFAAVYEAVAQKK